MIGRPAFHCPQFEQVVPTSDNVMKDFISEFMNTNAKDSSFSLRNLYSKLGINMSLKDLKTIGDTVGGGTVVLSAREKISPSEWDSAQTMQFLLPMGDMGYFSITGDTTVLWNQHPMYNQLCSLSVEQAQKIANLIATTLDLVSPESQKTMALGLVKQVIGSPAFNCGKFNTVVPKIDSSTRDFINAFMNADEEAIKLADSSGPSLTSRPESSDSFTSSPLFYVIISLSSIALIAIAIVAFKVSRASKRSKIHADSTS